MAEVDAATHQTFAEARNQDPPGKLSYGLVRLYVNWFYWPSGTEDLWAIFCPNPACRTHQFKEHPMMDGMMEAMAHFRQHGLAIIKQRRQMLLKFGYKSLCPTGFAYQTIHLQEHFSSNSRRPNAFYRLRQASLTTLETPSHGQLR